jgi:hypothetical protein
METFEMGRATDDWMRRGTQTSLVHVPVDMIYQLRNWLPSVFHSGADNVNDQLIRTGHPFYLTILRPGQQKLNEVSPLHPLSCRS